MGPSTLRSHILKCPDVTGGTLADGIAEPLSGGPSAFASVGVTREEYRRAAWGQARDRLAESYRKESEVLPGVTVRGSTLIRVRCPEGVNRPRPNPRDFRNERFRLRSHSRNVRTYPVPKTLPEGVSEAQPLSCAIPP